MRLAAVIGFYFDGIAGKRLLKNLTELNIPSLWADGRVHGFARIESSDLSRDGFPEIIQDTPNAKLFSVGYTYPQKETGPQFLFKKAAELNYDTVMVLGCDEYITGNWKKALKDLEQRCKGDIPRRFHVRLDNRSKQQKYNDYPGTMGRFYYLPSRIYRRFSHYGWCYTHNGREELLVAEHPPIKGITLVHDDSIRPAWRNELMDQYQAKCVPVERFQMEQFIKSHGDRYALQ